MDGKAKILFELVVTISIRHSKQNSPNLVAYLVPIRFNKIFTA